jgi:hypothetical protein
MADLIERQAAIDVLDVLCQEHRYRIPGKSETYRPYNEAWQDALDRAECAIGKLPSVQPEIMADGTLHITATADVANIDRILLSQEGTHYGDLYYKDDEDGKR